MVSMASACAASAGPQLDFSLGILEELRGNEGKATAFYESAHKAHPTSMYLLKMMADRLAEEGDRGGANELWEEALGRSMRDATAWIDFGDFLGETGRGDTVADRKRERAYLKALELEPGGYAPVERMVSLSREQENDDRAREFLETLDPRSSQAVLYYVSMTRSLYDSRNEEAERRIDERLAQAMREQPGSPQIAWAASEHYRLTKRLDRAIAMLQEHVEARPESLDLKIRLGILWFSAGEDVKGLRELREVLDVHPRKTLAHEALAKYYRKKGRAKEAMTHGAELLKIRGGSSGEFLELAEELMVAGEFRAARLLLEKAVFDHDGDVELRKKLAIATARDPETRERAGRLFAEVEEMAGGNAETDPVFLLESAKELLVRGEMEAAEARLHKAIRSFPPDARAPTAAAMRALAGIWINRGKNKDAARLLIERAEAMEK